MIAKLPRPRRFYTPEQWKEFIDMWQKSGLSQTAFCQQHELTPSAFDRWRTKITRLESGLSFPKTSPMTSFPSLLTGKSGLVQEKKHRSPRYYTLAQWKEIIDDWRKSGLSQDAYCLQKDLAPTTFFTWAKKLEDPELAKGASLQERPRYTLEQWKEFVEEWKESGLSRDAYCRKKDLAPTTFFNWSKKFEDPELAKIASLQERPHYTPNQWKEVVKEWKESGLSRATYCIKKGLNPSTLYKWEQRFKPVEPLSQLSGHPQKPQSPPASSFEEHFIPVMLKPSPLTNSSNVNPKIEVTLSQGHHLSIQGPFDWGNLIALLTSILRR